MVRRFTPETHPVIAIDLDNTIWSENFPYVGVPFPNAIDTINAMVENGYEVIIWTCRGGDNLAQCILFLRDTFGLSNQVKFNVHSNYFLSKYPVQSAKVAAHVYIDDKSYNSINFENYWQKLREDFLGE